MDLCFSGWGCWVEHHSHGGKMDSTAAHIRLYQLRGCLSMWMLLWTLASHEVEVLNRKPSCDQKYFAIFTDTRVQENCYTCRRQYVEHAKCTLFWFSLNTRIKLNQQLHSELAETFELCPIFMVLPACKKTKRFFWQGKFSFCQKSIQIPHLKWSKALKSHIW